VTGRGPFSFTEWDETRPVVAEVMMKVNGAANGETTASVRAPCFFRLTVLLFILLTVGASVSSAQVETQGVIQVVDEGDACETPDGTPGVRTLRVYHDFAIIASGSRFRIEAGPGVTMTYLSEVHHFPMTIGNTQDGITICYDACLGPSILVATMNYMAYGTSELCSEIRVVPHPDAETVEAMRCDGTALRAYVSDLVIRTPGGSCGCAGGHVFPGTPRLIDCSPSPLEPTTWGRIKALYRN
jgi:hypothetical protein